MIQGLRRFRNPCAFFRAPDMLDAHHAIMPIAAVGESDA
jgi:hypothetical protein